MPDIRLHVIPLTNEDTDAAGHPAKAYDVSPGDFGALIGRVNALYAPTGIRFLFDPQLDWAPLASTALNTDQPNQVELGNAIAAQLPGKMVCFLRWGGDVGRTGNGNAYPPRGVAPEPADTIPRVQNYVALPNRIAPGFGLLNQGNGSFVAHEFGHYLGLYHTFPGWDGYHPMYSTAPATPPHDPPTAAEADQALVEYITAHGGTVAALDGDALSDTAPDPSPVWHQAHGVDGEGAFCSHLEVTAAGTVDGKPRSYTLTVDPNNIMSYFRGCPESTGPDTQMSFSAQQITKMTATLEHPARAALVSDPQFSARSLTPGSVVALGPDRLLVVAADVHGQLWFSHWQQGSNDGRWDRWRPLLSGTGVQDARAEAVSRSAGKLDLFTTGTDGKTYTAAWDQARAGQWRGYWNVAGGAIPPGGAVTAVSRKPDQLDIFLVSVDGGVYTAAWNPSNPGGQWQGWWRVGDLRAVPGSRVAAVSRGPEKIDIFVAGADGKTYTAAWDAQQANGAWRGWWNVLTGAVPPGGSVTAVSRRPDQLDIFLVSVDGGVYTAAWNPSNRGGQWQGWWRIGDLRAVPGSPVSVVSRGGEKLDLFVAGADGKTYTAAWDAHQADGAWRGWWNILSGHVHPGGSIAAVSRAPGKLDAFLVSNDGAVYTAAWDREVADQQWRGWWKVGV